MQLAGLWQASNLSAKGQQVEWGLFGSGVAVSTIVALICIHYFLRYVQRFSLMPFVIYRLVLGVILLVVFL